MATDPVETAAARLRQAIAQQAHTQARKALLEYCRIVDETVRRLPPGDPAAARIAEQFHELVGWARGMVLTARAHCAAQLNGLRPPRPYGRFALPQSTWRLEA